MRDKNVFVDHAWDSEGANGSKRWRTLCPKVRGWKFFPTAAKTLRLGCEVGPFRSCPVKWEKILLLQMAVLPRLGRIL